MRLLFVLVAGFVFAGAPAAWAGCGGQETHHAQGGKAQGQRSALVIGDSTMILAAPRLARRGYEVDIHGCRGFAAGVSVVRHRRAIGALPHLAVLALGANGGADYAQMRSALAAVGRERVLGLMTPNNYADAREAMRRVAREFPYRVLLLDWTAHAAGHRAWIQPDDLHVTFSGAEAMTAFIARRSRGVVQPPVRALSVPRSARRAKACGQQRRAGRTLSVFVVRGRDRIACSIARDLVRRPPLQGFAAWSWFDWTATRAGPWTDVYRRRDGRVVLAARPAR